MNNWRKKLHGYTGAFIVFAIWAPMIWFVSSSMQYYKMETFELLKMNWFSILLFVALCVGTLIAQFGFFSVAREVSEFEKLKNEQATKKNASYRDT